MRHRSALTRITAATTIVALQMLLVVSAEPGAASLQGHVIARDGESPLAGARVHVREVRGDDFFSSGWTGPDGRFEVGGLPAALYEVAVEADGGLYLVDAPLTLAPGQTRSLQLAVKPNTDTRDEEDDDDRPGAVVVRGWSNPLTATLIVLGSAIGVGVLIESLDTTGGRTKTASPSAP